MSDGESKEKHQLVKEERGDRFQRISDRQQQQERCQQERLERRWARGTMTLTSDKIGRLFLRL